MIAARLVSEKSIKKGIGVGVVFIQIITELSKPTQQEHAQTKPHRGSFDFHY